MGSFGVLSWIGRIASEAKRRGDFMLELKQTKKRKPHSVQIRIGYQECVKNVK